MKLQTRIIDVHAHVIPEVDDGSREMEESLEMLKMAAEQGVCAVIATPHDSRRRKSLDLQERVWQLQDQIQKKYPDFCVYVGQETYYHSDLKERLKKGEAYTMAGSRYVLVEFSPSVVYKELYYGIRNLREAGYLPILAHMERYHCFRQEGTEELENMGCVFQMNYDSLQGNWFQKETRWCRKQVESGVIDLLGTDMHRIDWRAPEIGQALSWLDGHVSPERIQQLVYKNPLKIIRKEKIK